MSGPNDPLRPFRPVLLIILGIAAVLSAASAVEWRIDYKTAKAAEVAVASKWDEVYQDKALKACTSAADQGAYRAVAEAMQQTVIPMERMVHQVDAKIDVHDAKQAEHFKEDEKRFRRIERRVGITND